MSLLRVTALSVFATCVVVILLYPKLCSIDTLRTVFGNYLSHIKSYFSRYKSNEQVGPIFGLKISLILASFYAVHGLTSAFTRQPQPRKSKRQKPSTLILSKIPFHFMEIPVLLSLIVFGSVVLPTWTVLKYVKVLAGLAPIIPLLEVFALMTVVMAAGRAWAPKIVDSHDFIKVAVAAACFSSFIASFSVFYLMYAHFHLSTLISSLISSILTLMIVQVISCCQIDHATITDPALIFPYISYNLVLITMKSGISALLNHERDPQIYPKHPQKFLKIMEFLFSSATPGKFPSLSRQILQTFFSPVLVFHLLLQLALITAASADFEGDEDDDESEESYFYIAKKCFVNNLWPLFGKSFLVIIYTISWLEQCHPQVLTSTSSSFLDHSCGIWRWICIGCAISWYGKHLIFDGYNNNSSSSYTCDKAFWRQFHNLKE